MVALKSGIIMDQTDDGLLKWANGHNLFEYMQIT